LNLIASFFLAAILSAPAWGATPALPGTLNYVEGQAVIGTETLNAKSVGTVNLEAGQTLTTQTGKVEVLLTPGVFFRLGNDSSATLVSPSLTNTEVALSHGEAMVEVAEIHQDNLLRVSEGGATTQLLKTGVYGFDANSGNVQVFKGEALVRDGDHQVRIKGGHQFKVNQTASLKAAKFDKSEYQQTDLYRFSNLRSEYLAEANVDAAIAYGGGPGWYGAGWYWDPYFTAYTWIPGDGYFFSPFGWGFYSPLWVGYSPFYGRYYPRYAGGFARPFVAGHGHAFVGGRPGFAGRPAAAFRGPSQSGAAASHVGAMNGGFHGGGGGGGFHR
jgi:hypothetical protein